MATPGLLPPALYGRYDLVVAGVNLVSAVLLQWLRLGLLRFLPAYLGRPQPCLPPPAGGLPPGPPAVEPLRARSRSRCR